MNKDWETGEDYVAARLSVDRPARPGSVFFSVLLTSLGAWWAIVAVAGGKNYFFDEVVTQPGCSSASPGIQLSVIILLAITSAACFGAGWAMWTRR